MKTFNNKLIVLLDLSGRNNGGAQRRYLNLFKILNSIYIDYFLLINKSLYDSCIDDCTLKPSKNIIVRTVRFEQYEKTEQNKNFSDLPFAKKRKFRFFFGTVKGFIKLLISWFFFNVSLYKIVKKYRIKVIYGVFTGGIWSWALARIMKIQFIYSYNDSAVSMISSKKRDILSSEYWPLQFADKIDFLSNEIFEKLKKENINLASERALFTPNSFVLYDKFYPEYPKNKIVTFVSRLDFTINGISQKNPELFLEAIFILQQKGENTFNYLFIGDGPQLSSLKKKAAEWDLRNVDFKGEVSNPENFLKDSSIFISIQKDNNYPSQSLIEAMACENAIVASDVGETRKLVTENEGILVPLNAEKIAEAIQYLINNPDKCERLGKNARKKVLKEQTIEKYLEYFLDITKC